jgi:hypothetical protein
MRVEMLLCLEFYDANNEVDWKWTDIQKGQFQIAGSWELEEAKLVEIICNNFCFIRLCVFKLQCINSSMKQEIEWKMWFDCLNNSTVIERLL